MDTLAVVAIAIGVVAAISVVFVAMTDNKGPQADAPRSGAAAEAATPEPAPVTPPVAEARPGAAFAAMTTLHGQDPVIDGFLQIVSTELQKLRQQEEEIERRLKLMDGIATLMQEMQAGSPSAARQVPSRANGTGGHRPPNTRTITQR